MTDWLLVLILLSVAAVLTCLRFTGCLLDFDSVGPQPTPEYGETIKAEAIAYWRLGEPARTVPGDQATDEKGANHGEYQSTALMADAQSPATASPPVLQAGQPGIVAGAPSQTSVSVDGGYVSVPYSAVLNPPADAQFSVEAWVHPDWDAGESDLFRCVVAAREDTGATKHGYILYAGPVLDPATFVTTDPTQHWQAWVGDGTTWLMLVGSPVEVGQTTYLLLTYDGVTQTLTLDAIVNPGPETSPPPRFSSVAAYSPNPGKPLYIGMGATEIMVPPGHPLYPFLGRLQEIAFYDWALDADKAAEHASAGGPLG